MYLDDVWIAPEEVERIVWMGGELTLDLRWTLEDVSVLLDLPLMPLLRWHEDDPEGGIPVELRRWRFCPVNGLWLVLSCGAVVPSGETGGS